MRRVLLTGANGFLGSHILKAMRNICSMYTLGAQEQNVYSTDLAKEKPKFVSRFEMIVHNAGLAHDKGKSDEEYFNVNYEGTRRLCEAIDYLDYYPEHFVFISTVAVYGVESGEMINETAPLKGSSAYALSKIKAEKFLIDWCNERDVICTILRLPLVVGDNPPGNLGRMFDAISKQKFALPGRAGARKSVVLAEDVANLIGIMKPVPGIFNLTDRQHPSLATLADAIATSMKVKLPVRLPEWLFRSLARLGDMGVKFIPVNSKILHQMCTTLTFDDTVARTLLPWHPRSVEKFYRTRNEKRSGWF